MKLIQKANKQLRVDDVRAEALLKAGYVEIDRKTGMPIAAESGDEKENKVLKRENKELKKQVADLTAQLEAAKRAE